MAAAAAVVVGIVSAINNNVGGKSATIKIDKLKHTCPQIVFGVMFVSQKVRLVLLDAFCMKLLCETVLSQCHAAKTRRDTSIV